MTVFRSMLLYVPAACLLAQTPPQPANPAQQAPKPPSTIAPAPPPQTAPNVPPDKVIITVGDQKITAEQFNQIADSLPEQYRAAAKGPNRAQFADNLVRMMILASEARRQKLDESPAYKTNLRFQGENLLASMVYEQINKNSKPDEATLRKYFDEHQAEFEQVRARHILIRAQGSPVAVKPGQKDLTDAEALAKAQESENAWRRAKISPSSRRRNRTTQGPAPMVATLGPSATGRWCPRSSRPRSA